MNGTKMAGLNPWWAAVLSRPRGWQPAQGVLWALSGCWAPACPSPRFEGAWAAAAPLVGLVAWGAWWAQPGDPPASPRLLQGRDRPCGAQGSSGVGLVLLLLFFDPPVIVLPPLH